MVWFRRPVGVNVSTAVHPSDRSFVGGEWGEIVRAFGYAAASAFWVNPIESISRANNKPTQLALALSHGATIPETLITNDVEELGDFLDQHEEVIFKPLHSALWEVGEKKFGAYTSLIGRQDISPREKIQACPGIYQVRIPKAFEVRAQFFGATCFAVRIESQALDKGTVDWRRERGNPALLAEAIALPSKVEDQCRAIMRSLGLVSGAFDFIVTPSGDWIFLEVNEAGQFMFLEMWCESIPILDAFVNFLESRSPDFVYATTSDRVRLASIFRSEAFQHSIKLDNVVHGKYRHPGIIGEKVEARG